MFFCGLSIDLVLGELVGSSCVAQQPNDLNLKGPGLPVSAAAF